MTDAKTSLFKKLLHWIGAGLCFFLRILRRDRAGAQTGMAGDMTVGRDPAEAILQGQGVQRVNAQETVMVDNGKTDKDMTANQSPAAEAPVTEAASKEVEEVSSPKVGGAESEAEGGQARQGPAEEAKVEEAEVETAGQDEAPAPVKFRSEERRVGRE